MKPKPIICDPLALLSAGVRNVLDMAVLAHVGRCGLHGATTPAIHEALAQPYHSVRYSVDRLVEMKLLASLGREHTQGRAEIWIVTGKAWRCLIKPAEFSMFPQHQTPRFLPGTIAENCGGTQKQAS